MQFRVRTRSQALKHDSKAVWHGLSSRAPAARPARPRPAPQESSIERAAQALLSEEERAGMSEEEQLLVLQELGVHMEFDVDEETDEAFLI